MSIRAHISALELDGKLVRYMPRVPHPPKRRLYLGPEAQNDLNDPRSAVNVLVGKGWIIAALDRWTLGERIYGSSKRGEFLDRLDPPPSEVWEIRVTVPNVQARLFGRFAEPDTLILTKFHTRGFLGKRGSQAWKQAMHGCAKIWETHFPLISPFVGKDVHAYITENCDDFPI